jgi:hypothetical protein
VILGLVIRRRDRATIFSGVAFTRGTRSAESSSFALRRNGALGREWALVDQAAQNMF